MLFPVILYNIFNYENGDIPISSERKSQMNRKRIAVLIASIDREYQQDFVSGLEKAAFKQNMDICIFNTQGHMNIAISSTSETEESKIYDLPDLSGFDGVISLPATMGSEIALAKMQEVLRPVQELQKPHVSIDVPQDGAVMISFDDRISMEELTEHLITEHSAKKNAFVGGPAGSDVSRKRLEAVQAVMEKHELHLEGNMIFDGEWTRTGGRHAAEKILASGILPDAVICANDDMALSLIECLNEHKIYVPRDIAVTGFDALREAILRGMTTVNRPIERASRKAVEILKKWMEGSRPDQSTYILSTIPIYGESCGCYQKNDQIHEKLRVMGTERWNMERILTRVSMFSGTMAGVGDEKEAAEKIRNFAESWEIPEIYLCVDPGICRDTDANKEEEEYLLLYGIRDGKEYEAALFSKKKLAPVLDEEREKPVCLVFCPLYYRDRNFGYVAIRMGAVTGYALYSVLMLLNGALMSLYLQTNIRRYTATIKDMSVHDIMTGMLNRRGYMEMAPKVIEKARKEQRVFAVLSSDMDDMKQINDGFGHRAGDEAICRVGEALHIVEKYGLTPVHISGDEYLAYGIVKSSAEAENLADIVSNELIRINTEDPLEYKVTASIGIYAAVPGKDDSLDYFMTQADREMYAVKKKKKSERKE